MGRGVGEIAGKDVDRGLLAQSSDLGPGPQGCRHFLQIVKAALSPQQSAISYQQTAWESDGQ